MKQSIKQKKFDKSDRIEGNKIILYDFFPKAYRELKLVEIITPHKTHTYKIKKTIKGGYLFN